MADDDQYHDEVESIADGFRYTLCEECGLDLHFHLIGPDALGHAHAYCPPHISR